ncbi:MAG: orotidine-5'-phosphate decarboxylase [Bacteroidales bacterium]|nr:orotidine-5'-phosphate decarboxylase [Bacteroidales bacterium]
MNYQELKTQIDIKETLLCVGLDPDIEKIPKHILENEDPLFEFCKQIVDATHDLAISFKPNTAFFEVHGHKGWLSLEKISNYIKEKYPEIFLIADAKRGDIFHSSKMYAKTFFETLPFDAVTINPFLGKDVVMPFLEFKGKWIILLGLSSNPSAYDLQLIQELETREYIFEKIFKYGSWWGTENNTMFVVGATMAYKLQQIRHLAPKNFLLIPGIGAQGGSLEDVCRFGLTEDYGLIINSSRAIIYADDTEKFAEVARQKALEFKEEVKIILAANKKTKGRTRGRR